MTVDVDQMQQKGVWRHTSPVELTLLCGCTCRV